MSDPRMKTIWFFVGLMLLLMGALTFLAGIYQIFVPPATHTFSPRAIRMSGGAVS